MLTTAYIWRAKE